MEKNTGKVREFCQSRKWEPWLAYGSGKVFWVVPRPNPHMSKTHLMWQGDTENNSF